MLSECRTGFPPLVCCLDQLPLAQADGELICSSGHRWELTRGIPRMVRERANYADAFGLQWNTYRRTQLDSYTGTTISHDRLRRCLGESAWAELHGNGTVQVLEAGCGAGRFTEVLLKTPAARVTSTDFSNAVDANQENCPQHDRHRILQADILTCPFPPAQFDMVVCLGVVQHTPHPEATIRRLYEQVRPGGRLVLDHYTYSLARLTKTSQVMRPILKRLSPEAGLRWTERLVRTFLPVHAAVRRSRPLQMLLSRVSPVTCYYHAYPQLSDRLQYEWALLDTHDSLTDYYKHFRTKGQIERFLRSLGAVEIECHYGGNGVEARCRKPYGVRDTRSAAVQLPEVSC